MKAETDLPIFRWTRSTRMDGLVVDGEVLLLADLVDFLGNLESCVMSERT